MPFLARSYLFILPFAVAYLLALGFSVVNANPNDDLLVDIASDPDFLELPNMFPETNFGIPIVNMNEFLKSQGSPDALPNIDLLNQFQDMQPTTTSPILKRTEPYPADDLWSHFLATNEKFDVNKQTLQVYRNFQKSQLRVQQKPLKKLPLKRIKSPVPKFSDPDPTTASLPTLAALPSPSGLSSTSAPKEHPLNAFLRDSFNKSLANALAFDPIYSITKPVMKIYKDFMSWFILRSVNKRLARGDAMFNPKTFSQCLLDVLKRRSLQYVFREESVNRNHVFEFSIRPKQKRQNSIQRVADFEFNLEPMSIDLIAGKLFITTPSTKDTPQVIALPKTTSEKIVRIFTSYNSSTLLTTVKVYVFDRNATSMAEPLVQKMNGQVKKLQIGVDASVDVGLSNASMFTLRDESDELMVKQLGAMSLNPLYVLYLMSIIENELGIGSNGISQDSSSVVKLFMQRAPSLWSETLAINATCVGIAP